jgi:sterol desaturase/sphingolipid hydroxylase (fatty acid hydroxylase superfamily)
MDEWIIELKTIKTATEVGVLVLLLAWETAAPFFSFFGKDLRGRAIHLTCNLAVGVLNILLTTLAFAGVWFWVADWARQHQLGLLYLVKLPVWAHALGAIVLLDAWTYLWHRLNHRVPFLWRFHRMHHSDPRMDVTTASRFHLGEIFFSSVLRIPLIPLLGIQFGELLLYEILLLVIVQLHHANVVFPGWLERGLRAFIVTPVMHKVHHSRWQPETDSNYSSLLSVWDRVFRSFRLRDDPHTIQFGLNGFDRPDRQALLGLLRTPLDEAPRDR